MLFFFKYVPKKKHLISTPRNRQIKFPKNLNSKLLVSIGEYTFM